MIQATLELRVLTSLERSGALTNKAIFRTNKSLQRIYRHHASLNGG